MVEHLCSHHRHYLARSPDYYIQKAKACSSALHQLVEKIFASPKPPELMYRTCDGLLSLQRKTDAATFNRACEMALAHEKYTYGFVKNLIENKMTKCEEVEPDKPLPKHGNIRGKDYYQAQQTTINFETHDAN